MTIARLLFKGLTNFRGKMLESALALASVVLIAFLGILLFLVVVNMQKQIALDKGEIQCEIYWNNTAPLEPIRQDWTKIESMPGVVKLTSYDPGQGLQVLADSLGKGLDLAWFEGSHNPLPPTAVVRFRLDPGNPQAQVEDFMARVRSLPRVDRIHYNPLQLDAAGSWLTFSRSVLWPLMWVLLLLVGLIVGNTIKLAQLNFQEEIMVMRLVGGARWYIMLPLLSSGAFYALAGGILALALAKLAQLVLNELLANASFWLQIDYFSWSQSLMILGVMTAVAVIFSWVNIRN